MVEKVMEAVGDKGPTTGGSNVGCHPNWQPQWLTDVGHSCKVGITTEAGCYIVLCKDWAGNWKPLKHIPVAVVRFTGELATQGI